MGGSSNFYCAMGHLMGSFYANIMFLNASTVNTFVTTNTTIRTRATTNKALTKKPFPQSLQVLGKLSLLLEGIEINFHFIAEHYRCNGGIRAAHYHLKAQLCLHWLQS